MPKVVTDTPLYNALEAVVRRAGGNESEAARLLGVTRLKINRIRKAQGGATPAVRNEVWRRLEALDGDDRSLALNETIDTETIQIVRDVPGVALQVLRYMTGIIERDIGSEERSHAN